MHSLSIPSRFLISFMALALLSCLLWVLVWPRSSLSGEGFRSESEFLWMARVLTPRFTQALLLLNQDDGRSLQTLIQDCSISPTGGEGLIRIAVFDSTRKYLAGVNTDPSQSLHADFMRLQLRLEPKVARITAPLEAGEGVVGFLQMDFPRFGEMASHSEKTRNLLVFGLPGAILILGLAWWGTRRWISPPVKALETWLGEKTQDYEETIRIYAQGISDLKRQTDLQASEIEILRETIDSLCGAIPELTQSSPATARKPDSLLPENLETYFSRVEDVLRDTENFLKSLRDTMARGDVLTLNAFVEANRCGESAQGFSVVAEELRELHRKSQTQLNEFAGHVEDWRSARSSDTLLLARLLAYFDLGAQEYEEFRRLLQDNSGTRENFERKILRLADGFKTQAQAIEEISATLDVFLEAEHDLSQHRTFLRKFKTEIASTLGGRRG